MTQSEFYFLLDDLLEFPRGTIRGDEQLAAVPKWDSLAVIGFIALLDQHFGLAVPATKINACTSVSDLRNLVGSKITSQ